MLNLFVLFSLLASLVNLPTAGNQAIGLHITVRDIHGTGVAGVTIMVLTNTGDVIAAQTTDVEGLATFAPFEPTLVRVQVHGALATGTALIQRGDDATGMVFLVDGPGTQLDLRVETDGSVIPDPASMITPDTVPQSQNAITDAPTPGSAALPTMSAGIQPHETVDASVRPNVREASSDSWMAALNVVGVFVAVASVIGLALWMRQRGQL